jgi:hypothetical protein
MLCAALMMHARAVAKVATAVGQKSCNRSNRRALSH